MQDGLHWESRLRRRTTRSGYNIKRKNFVAAAVKKDKLNTIAAKASSSSNPSRGCQELRLPEGRRAARCDQVPGPWSQSPGLGPCARCADTHEGHALDPHDTYRRARHASWALSTLIVSLVSGHISPVFSRVLLHTGCILGHAASEM